PGLESFVIVNGTDVTVFAVWGYDRNNNGTPDVSEPEVDGDYFVVVYVGNGNTGGYAPVDGFSPYLDGERVVVLGQGSLTRAGYVFLGWSTNRAASVASYVAGSTFYIDGDVTLYAVWEKVFYTVEYRPGVHGTFIAQVTSGLSFGDVTPAAPTVTGEAGWKFAGWLPVPSATVTGDAIYTAQWTQDTTTPTPMPSPSVTPMPSPSVTPMPSPSVTPMPSPSVTPMPTLTPTPTGFPPVNGGSQQYWSLVNLVLSIVGIILAIIASVRVLLPQRQKQRKQLNSQNQRAAEQVDEQERRKWQNRKTWLFTAIALAIVGVIVFLLTEDLRLIMGMVDKWTVVNAIIFIVELIAIALIFKRTKETAKQQMQDLSTEK
ncbi:MAG: InlB B-repeat-containing protein, partial [Candidatus Bathyarchaeota archaeon]|nr:InlB B-repeat-containing protein [Candidatus Termiticorpusculum sp.]